MVICTWHNRALRGRSASHHFDKIDFPTLIKLIFPSVTKLTLKWMLNCTWHIRALHGVLTSYYFDKICFSISIKLISPLWQNWFAIKCWTAPGIFGHFMVDWHLSASLSSPRAERRSLPFYNFIHFSNGIWGDQIS